MKSPGATLVTPLNTLVAAEPTGRTTDPDSLSSHTATPLRSAWSFAVVPWPACVEIPVNVAVTMTVPVIGDVHRIAAPSLPLGPGWNETSFGAHCAVSALTVPAVRFLKIAALAFQPNSPLTRVLSPAAVGVKTPAPSRKPSVQLLNVGLVYE